MNHFVSSSHKWGIENKGNDFEVKEMWALAIEVESSVRNKFWLTCCGREALNIASRRAISHAQLPRWWKIKRLTSVCSSWTENAETVCWCARRYLAWMLISASIYDTRKYSLACLWIRENVKQLFCIRTYLRICIDPVESIDKLACRYTISLNIIVKLVVVARSRGWDLFVVWLWPLWCLVLWLAGSQQTQPRG